VVEVLAVVEVPAPVDLPTPVEVAAPKQSADPVNAGAQADLSPLKALDGFLGAALADAGAEVCLATLNGRGALYPAKAALAFGDVVRAKLKAIEALKLDDTIEDIVSVLGTQVHMIRPLADRPGLYLYLALDRESSNLALARARLKAVEADTRLG
jgi:hypothetical protein